MAGSSLYQSTSQLPTGVTVIQGETGESGFAVPIQTVEASGALAIDYDLGKHCVVNVNGNITSFSVINWPATGNFARLTVEFHNTGAYGITFPAAYKWSGGGTDPQLTSGSGKEDWFAFTTSDAGTTTTGHFVGANYI